MRRNQKQSLLQMIHFTMNHILNFVSLSVGMLGEDSWPPTVDFIDFLAIMDMEQTSEEEELMGEDKTKEKEDMGAEEALDTSSSAHTPNNNPTTHSEL